MELNQISLLEELLLAQSGGNSWATFHGGLRNESVSNPTTFDQDLTSNTSLLGLLSSTESNFSFPFSQPFNHVQDFATHEMGSSSTYNNEFDLPPVLIQQDFEGLDEDFRICPFAINNNNSIDGCKVEYFEQICEESAAGGAGGGGEKNSKMKKAGAPPSKNLMAERRRRKRLNDRLSMLRSIVPKISKMDRTAIVGDTIDYMKELLDKISKLRDENIINQNNMICGSICDDLIKPKESIVLRNTPKFDVERRKEDIRIELCCSAKPGMLLSTLGNLEALGLDVQQCVISCFNDFSLLASCSEVADHRGILSAEDIKQALFRNAGYGGRCL